MTVLHVPLHLPVGQAQRFLAQELAYRSVVSVKVKDNFLVIHHNHLSHEEKAELLSCADQLAII